LQELPRPTMIGSVLHSKPYKSYGLKEWATMLPEIESCPDNCECLQRTLQYKNDDPRILLPVDLVTMGHAKLGVGFYKSQFSMKAIDKEE
jgi:hypothetical protein